MHSSTQDFKHLARQRHTFVDIDVPPSRLATVLTNIAAALIPAVIMIALI